MIQKCKTIISWKQILQARAGLALTNSTDWPARRLLDSRSPWLTSTENNTLHITIVSWWGTYFILSEQYNYNAFLLFDLRYFESLPPKSLHHLIIRVDNTSTHAPTTKWKFMDKLVEQGFHFHWLTCHTVPHVTLLVSSGKFTSGLDFFLSPPENKKAFAL